MYHRYRSAHPDTFVQLSAIVLSLLLHSEYTPSRNRIGQAVEITTIYGTRFVIFFYDLYIHIIPRVSDNQTHPRHKGETIEQFTRPYVRD